MSYRLIPAQGGFAPPPVLRINKPAVDYRLIPYGTGRYDIGPYVKEYLFVSETDPTTEWTQRPDLNEDLWIKRPDTTQETWISVNDGTNG